MAIIRRIIQVPADTDKGMREGQSTFVCYCFLFIDTRLHYPDFTSQQMALSRKAQGCAWLAHATKFSSAGSGAW